MKKTLKVMAMVLFVFSLATLTSCTKSSEKLILGKWQLDRIAASYGGETYEFTMAEFAEMFGEDEVPLATLEFKDDGYVYSPDGDKASYSIDGEKLTITEDGESTTMNIVELTKTDLALSAEEDGVDMTLYFKKV